MSSPQGNAPTSELPVCQLPPREKSRLRLHLTLLYQQYSPADVQKVDKLLTSDNMTSSVLLGKLYTKYEIDADAQATLQQNVAKEMAAKAPPKKSGKASPKKVAPAGGATKTQPPQGGPASKGPSPSPSGAKSSAEAISPSSDTPGTAQPLPADTQQQVAPTKSPAPPGKKSAVKAPGAKSPSKGPAAAPTKSPAAAAAKSPAAAAAKSPAAAAAKSPAVAPAAPAGNSSGSPTAPLAAKGEPPVAPPAEAPAAPQVPSAPQVPQSQAQQSAPVQPSAGPQQLNAAKMPSGASVSPSVEPQVTPGTAQPSKPAVVQAPIAAPTMVPVAETMKALTCRILVAADDDVIPDWKAQRIAAVVPMNMPIKPFLERQLLLKLKWENMNHVIPHPAGGKDLSSIQANREEVFEINLTPHQLCIQPESVQWVWLRRSTSFDDPLKDSVEIYAGRLTRMYEFYDPGKVPMVKAVLSDFEGAEELLFLKLTAIYGPEPTREQWRRKKLSLVTGGFDQPSARRPAGSGFESQSMRPGETASGAGDTDQLAMSIGSMSKRKFAQVSATETDTIAQLVGRTSTTLLLQVYYRKWFGWRRWRKDLKRICFYLRGNMDDLLRRDYFSKWKMFFVQKKIKRQLQTSKQLAFKSETLVGDLATENLFLKGEIKKLRAQVEVLDSANSRRLESLFSSSESAIKQIRTLTEENEQKELLIGKLETKLMNVGNMMLKMTEERDSALETVNKQRVELENELSMVRAKLKVVEEAFFKAQEQIEAHKPKDRPAACEHCQHYFDALREADVLKMTHKMLCEKVETEVGRKAQLAEELKSMTEQKDAAVEDIQRLKGQLAARAHYVDPASIVQPQTHSLQGSFARKDTGETIQSVESSFALREQSRGAAQQNMVEDELVYDASGVTRAAYSSQLHREPEARCSLDSFFAREEQLSREKIKMFIDRRAQQRPSPFFASQQQGAPEPFFGGQGTHFPNNTSQPSSQTDSAVRDFQQAYTRPTSNMAHSQYVVAQPQASNRQMRTALFSFTPSRTL